MAVVVRRRSRTLVFALVLALLVAGVGELGLAVLLRAAPVLPAAVAGVFREYYLARDRPVLQMRPDCARYDSGLTYTLKPGRCRFAAPEFDTEVTVNRLGVRDDEASLAAPPIIVLGDSIAMGWGVQKAETFADRLEQALGVAVLDLGVPSYGTAREFGLLRRADVSHLRWLIVQYHENDLTENRTFVAHEHDLPVLDEAAYVAERDAYLRGLRYYPGKHLSWLFQRAARVLAGRLHAAPAAPARAASPTGAEKARLFFEIAVDGLRKIPGLDAPGRAPLRLSILGAGWTAAEGAAALAAAGGWPVPVAGPVAVPMPSDPALYFRLDGHPTAAGHAAIAARLIEADGNPVR